MSEPENHSRARLGCALLLALGGFGCADLLPDPNHIVRTRLLAVRTEVTQPLLADGEPTTRAQALPFETVRIEPFVVGPTGPVDVDGLEPLWLACELPPGSALLSCLQRAMPLELDVVPACPVPDSDALGGGELSTPPSPCVVGRAATPSYTVPLSANVLVGGSIELTMIAGDPDGPSTEACAQALLAGDTDLPNACLFGVQRLTVGPLDYFVFVAEQLGVEVPGVEVPDADEVSQPDRNPRISAFSGAVLDDEAEPGQAVALAPGDVIALELDQTLRIDASQPLEDLQSYDIPVNDGEQFERRDEAYSAQWYRSWGRLLSPVSDDPDSYNEWSLRQDVQDETESPPGGRAFLYYVVRDGRQGVAWWWFEVQVAEPG